MKKLIEWFNVRTGYRFWYQVKFVYMSKGQEIFSYYTQIGLASKNTILDSRACKKIVKPVHMENGVNKRVLKNASFEMRVVSYLGYLKN